MKTLELKILLNEHKNIQMVEESMNLMINEYILFTTLYYRYKEKILKKINRSLETCGIMLNNVNTHAMGIPKKEKNKWDKKIVEEIMTKVFSNFMKNFIDERSLRNM